MDYIIQILWCLHVDFSLQYAEIILELPVQLQLSNQAQFWFIKIAFVIIIDIRDTSGICLVIVLSLIGIRKEDFTMKRDAFFSFK